MDFHEIEQQLVTAFQQLYPGRIEAGDAYYRQTSGLVAGLVESVFYQRPAPAKRLVIEIVRDPIHYIDHPKHTLTITVAVITEPTISELEDWLDREEMAGESDQVDQITQTVIDDIDSTSGLFKRLLRWFSSLHN